MSLQLRNDGTGPARSALLTLSESDPYISINGSSTQNLGNIPAGAELTSPAFSLEISQSCPQAHVATIQFELTANSGFYTTSGSFALTIGLRELLFVDADNEVTETRITDALDARGRSYVRWNTYDSGMETVPVDTLRMYRTVLWAAGDQNANSVTSQNQTNLSSYLDEGGALLLSAENYSTSYGGEAFTSNYLHVSAFTASSGSAVNGETGDPIGNGAAVGLSYHADLSDLPDRVDPATGAATVFSMDGSGDPVVIRYPSGGSGTYRVVFFGVPLEAFATGGSDPNNIETVLDRSLTWLGGDVLAPTSPSNPAFAQDGTLSWSPASDNVGVDHYCVYRTSLAYFEVQGMTPQTTTTATSILMTEGLGDPNLNYFYRVTAKDAAGNQSAATPAVGELEFVTP
jgi:hypothetical protein